MKNGLLVDSDGTIRWYKEGDLHREDGPAVEFANDYKEWYYQGKHIECNNQQYFEKFIKLIAFW